MVTGKDLIELGYKPGKRPGSGIPETFQLYDNRIGNSGMMMLLLL